MTTAADESAFLTAIAAAPDDDTPRLVYADWLDDHEAQVECRACKGSGGVVNQTGGYREFSGACPKWESCKRCDGSKVASNGCALRAEFIRVQCEWERVQSDGSLHCPRDPDGILPAGGDCPCRWCFLRHEERRLWGLWPDEHGMRVYFHRLLGGGSPPTEWVILPGTTASSGMGGRAAVVRRGFVDEVRVTATAWVGDVCEKCDGRPEQVRFRGPGVTNPYHWECDACDGTGNTGLAGPVMTAHPTVQVVVLFGRYPAVSTDNRTYGQYFWQWIDDTGPLQSSNRLPRKLIDRMAATLPRERVWVGGDIPVVDCYFPTRQDAALALDAAALAHGRAEAKKLRPICHIST